MTAIADAFTSGLILPAICLAALGWAVPRLLALIFPEGVGPLMVLAFVATLIMFGLGMAFFMLLYLWQGVPFAMLFEGGIAGGIGHFARLGLISALLWAPIMILSVAGLPKNWVEKVW
jgi:hypothetical protein